MGCFFSSMEHQIQMFSFHSWTKQDFLPRARRTKLWIKCIIELTPRPNKGEKPCFPKHQTKKGQKLFEMVLSVPVEYLYWGIFALQWCEGTESYLKQTAEGFFLTRMGIGIELEETVLYHLLPSLVQRRGKGQECLAPLLAAWFTADQFKLLPIKRLYC